MAILTNTFTTYGAKGIREDLSDVIANISPEDTPFLSNLGKGPKPGNTFFEWQQDSLANADNTNAQLEGDDVATFDVVNPTTRVGNYCQISRKTAVISETEEAVDKAGRDDEEAYQAAKKGAELKRDIETILVGTNQAGATGNTTTARKTAAILAWIRTNVDKAGDGANPSAPAPYPGGTRTDGTARTFTEAMLKNVIELQWAQGGHCDTVMVDGVQKQSMSTFSGIATKTINQSAMKPATVIGAVDFYVSDFGTFQIVPNRFQRHRDALVLDFDLLKIRWLRPIARKDLAKTGDADKFFLRGEYGLEVRQEAGLGLVADLL